MNDIEVFRFPVTGQHVRTITRDSEPWFVAADICAVLDIGNPSQAVSYLDDDERETTLISSEGGQERSANIVSEPGLYSLILRSRKPEAKAFKRWITHDVLPAIRKTGRYETEPDELEQALRHVRVIEEKRAALARAEAAEYQVHELAPKAEQADFHRAADGLITPADFANKVKAWAKREHGVQIRHSEVWDFLGQIGLLIRGKTVRHNHPTAFAVEKDYVRIKETEYERSDGAHTSVAPRLTPAGEGWAWDRAVRRIAEHGTLRPTGDLERARS